MYKSPLTLAAMKYTLYKYFQENAISHMFPISPKLLVKGREVLCFPVSPSFNSAVAKLYSQDMRAGSCVFSLQPSTMQIRWKKAASSSLWGEKLSRQWLGLSPGVRVSPLPRTGEV